MRAALLFVMLGGLSGFASDTIVLATAGKVEPKITQPFAGEFDKNGSFLFVEMVGGERLRRVNPDGTVETLAGSGKKAFDPEAKPALEASFNGMHNLAIAPDGLVYLADTFNHAIRVYDPKAKTVTIFAGTGKPGYAGDGGPADKAQFTQAICIAMSRDGRTLFVADIGNRRVRAIDLESKVVRTVAGTGAKGTPQDGEQASKQPLTDPRAVCVDSKGNLYVLERGGHRLYAVDPEGKIRAVAGTGKAGYTGDGGPALQAAFNGPKFIACDADDSVLIVDTENHAVRRYVPGKEVVLPIAGTGKAGAAGLNGDPKAAMMKRPHGATIHPKTGELWIADSENHRLLKIVSKK